MCITALNRAFPTIYFGKNSDAHRNVTLLVHYVMFNYNFIITESLLVIHL